MGKRRASSQHLNHHNLHLPSSSAGMPCSSGTELLSNEPSFNLDAGMEVRDGSMKLLNPNSSVGQRHYNFGRSIFSKRSRRYYDQHYQFQNFGNHSNPSTSRAKISPLHDERLSFKFTDSSQEPGRQSDGRQKAFGRPERIRSNLLVTDPVSPDKVKMICGLCQKHLRRKPYFLGNTLASTEFSVVAVLVCGHAYHADCLEGRTSFEDRRDPPCPLCSGSPSQV